MANRNRTALIATCALALVGWVATASADTTLRYADASGNLIMQKAGGGAKIIRVGAAHKDPTLQMPRRAQGTTTITAPQDKAVAYIVGPPNSSCESAVLLRGRSFMYGLDSGETPVLDHPGC
ncbi:hypothetical protein F9K79_00095 [Ochrobactrum sp. Kaboul]|nr:hypothetical protein F9K79_00095 [Ochrobactrum sp. Kaboul]